MSDFETKEPFTWNQTDELKNKVKELEKDLAYFKAIYNTLIDGAARDTNRINELEAKLSHQIQLMDAMTRTSQNNYELSEKVKDLEYQLEQQKIMNPISVNMIATIEELSKKLNVAVKALEFYGNQENWMRRYKDKTSAFTILDPEEASDIERLKGGYAVAGKRARQALKEITSEQGEKE